MRHIALLGALALAMVGEARAAGPSLLFDPATGAVLSQDRAGEPWYPASLTKLMTAYLVFQKVHSGKLKLDRKVIVSRLASSQPPSKIGIKPGSTVSVDFALQALLVYSANDMAYVLAEAAAGNAAAFVGEMNAEAKRLGMSATHYSNPNGLHDPRQVSSARDIAVVSAALLREFPEHAHYFSQDHVTVGKRKLANRNSLIRQMKAADGMKTGFICNSGFNLVATATIDGRKLAAVVLGAQSGKHRVDLAEMLLVDGFARKIEPGRPGLDKIPNMRLGSVVPADLTGKVCKKKPAVEITPAKTLTGWGISFGTYENAEKANMALRGRLLSPIAVNLEGSPAVIRMAGQTGYAAILWGLTQPSSLSACARYRESTVPCEVMTPETFARIAALTPDPPKANKPPTAQGSDGGKPAKKKKKKSNGT